MRQWKEVGYGGGCFTCLFIIPMDFRRNTHKETSQEMDFLGIRRELAGAWDKKDPIELTPPTFSRGYGTICTG